MKSQGRSSPILGFGNQSLIFFSGSVFTFIVGWPFQIYVARQLGAHGLGVFVLLDSVVTIVATVLSFGLSPALVRFIPLYLSRSDYAYITRLIRFCVWVLLGCGVVGWAAIVAGRTVLVAIWPELKDYESTVFVMAFLLPVTLLSFLFSQGLRGFQDIRYVVIGSAVVQLSVKVVLAICLLSIELGLLGYAWAVVVSSVVGATWMAVGLRRRIKTLPANNPLSGSTKSLAAEVEYAKVNYAGSLFEVAASHLDRFLLGSFAGASLIGVLAVVRVLQQLPMMFLQMLIVVAAPMFSAASSRSDFTELRHLYYLATDWLVRLSAPLVIFLLVFSSPILNLYGPDFAKLGQWVLIVMLLGQSVNLISGPIGNLLNYSGFERPLFKLSVVSTLLQASAMVLLVPRLGVFGVAVASAVGSVFLNVAALRIARSNLNISWGERRYLRWIAPFFVASVLAVLLRYVQPDPGIWGLGLSLLAVFISFHSVSLAQGLHEDDWTLLKHWGEKIKQALSRR